MLIFFTSTYLFHQCYFVQTWNLSIIVGVGQLVDGTQTISWGVATVFPPKALIAKNKNIFYMSVGAQGNQSVLKTT